MKTFHALAVAATLAAAVCLPAHAVVDVEAPPVACTDSLMTFLNDGYAACQGPVAGAIGAALPTVSFAGFGSFHFAGATDDASGAFLANPGAIDFGTLALAQGRNGNFVIGVQGGGTYSLYLYGVGDAGASTLSVDTFGVVDASGSAGPSLTRAALYVTSPVPEPATAAMFGVALAAGAVLRRRRGAE